MSSFDVDGLHYAAYPAVMAGYRKIRRIAAALLTLLAMTLNGAQAHVVMTSQSDTFMICNPAGVHQTITIATGDYTPASTEGQTCCGDCISVAATMPAIPVLQPLRGTATHWHVAQAKSQVHPGSPLWPGAPPHGPPTTL